MLHNLVTQYVVNKLIDENHPTIEYGRCVNGKQRRKECTVCQDICPKQVIRYDKKQTVDWTKCANCNICVSMCPSRAIRSSAVNMNRLLGGYEASGGDILVACQREEAQADVKFYCVASVPWEVFAGYALTGTVKILCRKCGECGEKECLAAFEETKKRLREFLGEALYGERILVVGQGEELPKKLLSRREMFRLMFTKSRGAISSLLPEDENLKMDGMLYRRLLAYRLEHPEHLAVRQNNFGWRTPVFSEKCWGCGICAKICPHGAIQVSKPQGEYRFMRHVVWKCQDCGICQAVCLEHAIDGVAVTYTAQPARAVSTRVHSLTCSECKEPVKPGTGPLCMACSAKNRHRKVV